MGCPDAECHANLQELKDCTKILKKGNVDVQIDIGKKMSRKEFWVVLAATAGLIIPIVYTSSSRSVEWKLEREARSFANKMAIEVISKETQKDIANINEKICTIQQQQEQLPGIVSKAVKDAMKEK